MHREDQDIFNIHNSNQLHTESKSEESTDNEAKVSTSEITSQDLENIINREECVPHNIRNNLPGCDFFTCIFVAALQTYRADQCLRPFPSLYMTKGHKDFETLVSIKSY